MRMNRAVVIRAAAGLAAYLHGAGAGRRRWSSSGTTPATRRTTSPGHRRRDDRRGPARGRAAPPLPTPVLAFAVRHLGAVAGVMVTASHNPPRDNGYKVYLGDGAQIVPPADAAIAEAIAAVGPLAGVPRPTAGWEVLGRGVVEAYLAPRRAVLTDGSPRDAARSLHPAARRRRRDALLAAFERAGFPAPVAVAEQAEPDPDFPTVAFPNPEEPGAMDLASRGRAHGAAPTWSSPTTRTPTGARSPCRTRPPRRAGGCCAATRWARCSPTHLRRARGAAGTLRRPRSSPPRCCADRGGARTCRTRRR